MLSPLQIEIPPAKKWQRCYLDIETSSQGELLDIGMIGPDVQYSTLNTWNDFIELCVSSNCKKQQWFAHNGCGFDWIAFIQHWLRTKNENEDFEITRYIVAGKSRLIGFEAIAGKNKIRFCDSLMFLKTSLEKAAKNYAIVFTKSKEAEKFKDRMEIFKKLHPGAYYSYLEDDVNALKNTMEKFCTIVLDKWQFADLSYSIPSMALKVFRAHYLDFDIYTPTVKEKEFTREAYSGGLTGHYSLAKPMGKRALNKFGFGGNNYKEARVHLYQDVNHYDVNSTYPAIMSSMVFPRAAGFFVYEEVPEHLGIYEIEYRQLGGRVPVLKPQNAGKRSAYGEREGHGNFTSIEINYLRELGADVKILRGVVYPETSKWLAPYALNMYNERLQAGENKALNEALKHFLNNLYGKFGEREEDREIVIMDEKECRRLADQEGIDINVILDLIEDEQLCEITYDPPRTKQVRRHVFPAVAAFITAAARVQLLRVLNDKNRQAIYCDTDSIMLANGDTLPATLIDPKKLGAWKFEAHYEWAAIFGKKQYVTNKWNENDNEFELKAKNKGAPRVDAKMYLAAMLESGEYLSEYRSPMAFKTAIKNLDRQASKFEAMTRRVKRQGIAKLD